MKWGDKYPAEYVDKLYGMVARHVTPPFRFVCMTDRSEGIRPEVECLPCPTVPVPPPHNNRGWRKVSLWNDSLPGMDGDWLYLDLDVVVTGTLDGFFEYAPQLSYIVMQNWTQPGKGIGNTSVFRFRVGSHPYLLHELVAHHDELIPRYRNSQTYISRTVKDIAFWPDEWCILFKTHCIPPMPQRWWKPPSFPPLRASSLSRACPIRMRPWKDAGPPLGTSDSTNTSCPPPGLESIGRNEPGRPE